MESSLVLKEQPLNINTKEFNIGFYQKILKFDPCPRFLIKTAGYRRLIEKSSVRIGFSFYTLVFTDFSAISLANLMILFVFIKTIGL